MLELHEVVKVHRRGLLATEALRGVSLRVEKGEFISIRGPSGSGKTTLLNVLGLLEPFDAGTYALDGAAVGGLSEVEEARLRNRAIGFVFQSYNLIGDLDVFDNLDLPLRYRGLPTAERRQRVENALQRVEMQSRQHHLPSELSGGQQQRVAIARAIVGTPALLLCDEPTGNLDSLAARQIAGLLEELNRTGITLVLVTHAAELAARAHRQLHLIDGRLLDLRAPRVAP